MPVCPLKCKDSDGRSVRTFKTGKALFAHASNSRKLHPVCSACEEVFANKDVLAAHHKALHSDRTKHECRKCRREFRTRDALDEHYRGSVAHPNCQKCGKGFLNETLREEHFKTHRRVPCETCNGRMVYEEDLRAHYSSSRNHPSCAICNVGFFNDEELDKHAQTMHADLICEKCNRQFAEVDELKKHFLHSFQHPQCSDCHVGFPDDDIYNAHMAAEHPPAESPSILDPLNTKANAADNLEYSSISRSTPDTQRDYHQVPKLQTVAPTEANWQSANDTRRVRKPVEATPQHRSSLENLVASWDSRSGTNDGRTSVWPSRVLSQMDSILTNFPSDRRFEQSTKSSPAGTYATLSNKSSISSLTGVTSVYSTAAAQDFVVKGETHVGLAVGAKSWDEFDDRLVPGSTSMVDELVSDNTHSPSPQSRSLLNSPSCRGDTHQVKQALVKPILTLNNQKWHADAKVYLTSNRTSTPSPDVGSPLDLVPLPGISPIPSTPTDIPSSFRITSCPLPFESASSLCVSRTTSQSSIPNASYAFIKPTLPHISTRVDGAQDMMKSSVSTSLNQEIDRHGYRGDDIFSMQLPSAVSPAFPPPLNQKSMLKGFGSPHLRVSTQPECSPRSIRAPRLKASSSLGELPPNIGTESSVSSSSSGTAVPFMSLHCRQCQRDPCEYPTATCCGHIFCWNCISNSLVASPQCPVCGNACKCLVRLDFSR